MIFTVSSTKLLDQILSFHDGTIFRKENLLRRNWELYLDRNDDKDHWNQVEGRHCIYRIKKHRLENPRISHYKKLKTNYNTWAIVNTISESRRKDLTQI